MRLPSISRALVLAAGMLLAAISFGAQAHGGRHPPATPIPVETQGASEESIPRALLAATRAAAGSTLPALSVSHCPVSPGSACGCAGPACITAVALTLPAFDRAFLVRPYPARLEPAAPDEAHPPLLLLYPAPPRAPPHAHLT